MKIPQIQLLKQLDHLLDGLTNEIVIDGVVNEINTTRKEIKDLIMECSKGNETEVDKALKILGPKIDALVNRVGNIN